MSTARPSDPVEVAVSVVVDQDEALRRRATRLTHLALDEAERILLTGTPSNRASIVKIVVPVMARAFNAEQTDARVDAMQEAITEMADAFRARVAAPARMVEAESEIPTDMPPVPPDEQMDIRPPQTPKPVKQPRKRAPRKPTLRAVDTTPAEAADPNGP